MADSEPPTKKVKTTASYLDEVSNYITKLENSTKNLDPIISKEFTDNIPTTDVYTAVIKETKNISKAILLINEKCPLRELQHLKRVRKAEIIIAKDLNGLTPEQFIRQQFPELDGVFVSFHTQTVPEKQPKLKWQFEKCNRMWPCNFHPDKYNEKLFSGSFFTDDELATHKLHMISVLMAMKICTWKGLEIEGATVVRDAETNLIVAISVDNRSEHPIQHPAMLAIDKVARKQNGGIWAESEYLQFDEDLKIKLQESLPNLKFATGDQTTKICQSSKIGPYLCTGYYVYTYREPCVLCSMALVHARAKRIFFLKKNPFDGALETKAKLQTISSLNHHFEVFTNFF